MEDIQPCTVALFAACGCDIVQLSFDKAMAAKISAARELARRLAEEKQAAKVAPEKGRDEDG